MFHVSLPLSTLLFGSHSPFSLTHSQNTQMSSTPLQTPPFTCSFQVFFLLIPSYPIPSLGKDAISIIFKHEFCLFLMTTALKILLHLSSSFLHLCGNTLFSKVPKRLLASTRFFSQLHCMGHHLLFHCCTSQTPLNHTHRSFCLCLQTPKPPTLNQSLPRPQTHHFYATSLHPTILSHEQSNLSEPSTSSRTFTPLNIVPLDP